MCDVSAAEIRWCVHALMAQTKPLAIHFLLCRGEGRTLQRHARVRGALVRTGSSEVSLDEPQARRQGSALLPSTGLRSTLGAVSLVRVDPRMGWDGRASEAPASGSTRHVLGQRRSPSLERRPARQRVRHARESQSGLLAADARSSVGWPWFDAHDGDGGGAV